MGKGRLTSSDRAYAVSSRIAADRSRVCAWRERDECGGDHVTPVGSRPARKTLAFFRISMEAEKNNDQINRVAKASKLETKQNGETFREKISDFRNSVAGIITRRHPFGDLLVDEIFGQRIIVIAAHEA